ncbi:TetR/AcrR family transcriptional regulator [Streptacidiphilus rugosus]|uniref:TetR/AcrR family transcriptional regulator n=1 Tax=Streptacidiphilus rugosus TaxID=405783 RepID=UPI0007C7A440|nr:TetR/AcrR family transcriptional regulator [Streptacidiphilus rugosus]
MPQGPRDRGPDPRTLRTRAAVAEAATTLFLRNGYQDTGVDEIAALAGVSKRSIYNNFADKQTLFTELVLGFTSTAGHFADELVGGLTEAEDLPAALHDLGRRHLRTVARPEVLRLRRLIIVEAARFPDLAAEYYRRAPGRVIAALTESFAELHRRGALTAADPGRAAQHFSYLVLGSTLDTFLFDPEGALPSPAELDRLADDAVTAFLAAYRA